MKALMNTKQYLLYKIDDISCIKFISELCTISDAINSKNILCIKLIDQLICTIRDVKNK